MKVYSIKLNRNDSFVFYKKDGILICINDPDYILPIQSRLWTKKDGFTSKGPYYDRVTMPHYRIYPEERLDFLKPNVLDCIKSCENLNKDYPDDMRHMNCFIPYKNLEDGTIELSVSCYGAIGKTVDQELTSYVERQFNLKAFW